METAYKTAVLFRNFLSFSLSVPSLKRKKPEVIKKKGTAMRAIMRVSIKSAAELISESGEVCMAITSIAAISLKASRAGYPPVWVICLVLRPSFSLREHGAGLFFSIWGGLEKARPIKSASASFVKFYLQSVIIKPSMLLPDIL